MSSSVLERRRFPRLLVVEDARALDQNGNEIGRVKQISGSGVLVHCSSESIADHLIHLGETEITLVEARSQSSDAWPVVVRYREGRNVGFEFTDKQSVATS